MLEWKRVYVPVLRVYYEQGQKITIATSDRPRVDCLNSFELKNIFSFFKSQNGHFDKTTITRITMCILSAIH